MSTPDSSWTFDAEPPIVPHVIEHDDRQACDYCGVPLDTGDHAYTDLAEDGIYCSRRHGRKNLEILKERG